MIVEEEQKGEASAEYGKELIPLLAKRLTIELGKGFSASNLWNCRLFFQVCPILDTLCRELSWSHYRLLMRVENDNARDYYMREANSPRVPVRKNASWTSPVVLDMVRNFESALPLGQFTIF